MPIGLPVEAKGHFSGRGVGNDGLGAPILQPLAQLRAVIGLIAEQPLSRLGPADQACRGWAIVCLATGQQEGKKTAFSICDCVDFRIASAARTADRLVLLPPFPPEAERCALMCVLSIICVASG